MEERVLIKSEPYNIINAIRIIAIICVILAPFIFFPAAIGSLSYVSEDYELYVEHHKYYYDDWEGHWEHYDALCHYGGCEGHEINETKFQYYMIEAFEYINITYGLLWLIPIGILLFLAIMAYLWLRSYELTVTDKRIYGKLSWGKSVELPVDSISATATVRFLKGVSVSTSGGRISFLALKNADVIHKTISNLLIERQKENNNASNTVVTPKGDEADQIKKFKELLDIGAITQEEFDAKKGSYLICNN